MNTKIALRIFTSPILLLIALVFGLCHAIDFFCSMLTRPLDQPLDQFLIEDTAEKTPL